MQALYTTMQCNGKLYNVHDILSYFCNLILIFFCFLFCFLWKTQIDCLFLKDVITHVTSSYLFKCLWGLPQSVCFVWFSHLTILEWRQWSRLIFNQSTKILILGFSLFFKKKNFDYSAQEENIWLWERSHASLKDGNGPLHFGIWPSETFSI